MRDITDRVAALLRTAATPSVPLSRVHVALVAEVGPGLGSYAQLRNELARRSDLFLLLEPHSPLADAAAWSGGSRTEYEAALVDAGADGGLRVALAPPRPPDRPTHIRVVSETRLLPAPGATTLNYVDASLVLLWGATPDDPVLRSELAEAVTQAEEIRRVLDSNS